MNTISADDGDRLVVKACALFDRQGVVRIDIHNECHSEAPEYDCITLSPLRARSLAWALLKAADLFEQTAPPAAARLSIAN